MRFPKHTQPEISDRFDDEGLWQDRLNDEDYWHSLINERKAAGFLDLTDRTLQALRQRGGGPRYVVISARCIRYRRIDLRAWVKQLKAKIVSTSAM